jgi:hypothetical protein
MGAGKGKSRRASSKAGGLLAEIEELGEMKPISDGLKLIKDKERLDSYPPLKNRTDHIF